MGARRFVWFGMLLGFEATSVLSFWGWGFGVSVFVLCLCALAWWVLWGSWPVLWGCGVVVWELYSEREHLIR